MGRVDEIFGWYLSKLMYEWNPIKARRKRSFYKSLIEPKDLCFDVGSHLGDRVVSWLSIGASVVAFEPQQRFSQYLDKKFNTNSKFHLENIGLSYKEGAMEFNVCQRYPTLSSLSGKDWENRLNENSKLNINFDSSYEIKVSTLDNMISKYGLPSFIKIDVEGHESEVLKGLSQKVKYLSFEFLNFNNAELLECLKKCESLGYTKFNWSYQEEFKFRLDNWSPQSKVLEGIGKMDRKVFSGDIYVKGF